MLYYQSDNQNKFKKKSLKSKKHILFNILSCYFVDCKFFYSFTGQKSYLKDYRGINFSFYLLADLRGKIFKLYQILIE